MSDTQAHETFAEFKNSFSYGSRTDLNFKFLKQLSDADAADFLQDLLWKLADACDDGDLEPVAQHIRQGQERAYAGTGQWSYDDGPFTPLGKPLAEARVALLTSTGHFLEGHDPEPFGVKNMSQDEATARINDFLKSEPTLSEIPVDTQPEALCVRHGGYDIRGGQVDRNVNFPIDRLRELADAGVFGELTANAYSFVGACAQTRLLRRTGPKWVQRLQQAQIDAALLVPV